MNQDFRKVVEQQMVVFDGAMGTMLYSRGIFINQCFDHLNLIRPELVRKIHREYAEAGALVVETNTFGANKVRLAPYGLGEMVAQINKRGVELAREAVGDKALVAGSVGPLGKPLSPYGSISLDDAKDYFSQQAQTLITTAVDLIILETFGDLSELKMAINAVREISDLPLIAQMTLGEDKKTIYGLGPREIAAALDSEPVDVIGLNCSVGPAIILECIEEMRHYTTKPLSAQPNAGLPKRIESRLIYLATPEYMAEYAKRMVQIGVRVIGACCGSTPAHIKAISAAVRAVTPGRAKSHIEVTEEVIELERKPEIPLAEKSALSRKINQRQFVTSIEIDPPFGSSPDKALESARAVHQRGVDAINIADGPRASARMSPLALALLFEQQVGIETILHYCCRDRNILGIQSDLLGAHNLGIRNLLVVTGDPPKLGDYPYATAVFDVDSIGLVRIVKNLNQGLDLAGKPIGDPTSFFIGVGVNPGAIDIDTELRRFEQKVANGAEYALTQPAFDVSLLKQFLQKVEGFRIPILVGILPLYSYKNAEFLHNEVPGMQIPDKIRERMRRAGSGPEAQRQGVLIAREALQEAAPMVQGAYLMPPFGKVELALQVLEK